MNKNEMSTYLSKVGILENAHVSDLGHGEANMNYLAQAGDRKVVVRTLRDYTPIEARFKSEHQILQFIESLGLDFMPRSLHYDPELQIHVVSYVEGLDASILDLKDVQQKQFVTQLRTINGITFEEYEKWCKSNGVAVVQPSPQEFRVAENITNRFNYIQSQTPDDFAQQTVEWATPLMRRVSTLAYDLPTAVTFVHGDLRWNKGGGNLRITSDAVTFIDWESSEFIEDSGLEIADVLGSMSYSPDNATRMKKLYDIWIHDSEDVHTDNKMIEYGFLWCRLGMPLWAAEWYYLMKNSNSPGFERYKELALLGMKDASASLPTPFSDWLNSV